MEYNTDKICVFDLEADMNRGLDVWSKEFKLISAAFMIKNPDLPETQEYYTTDIEEIYYIIEKLYLSTKVLFLYRGRRPFAELITKTKSGLLFRPLPYLI